MPVRKLFKTPTLGGAVFWADIAKHEGWRIQYNQTLDSLSPLKPYRLLDPDDYLIASADEAVELQEAIGELAEQYAKRDPAIDFNTVCGIMSVLVGAAVKAATKEKNA